MGKSNDFNAAQLSVDELGAQETSPAENSAVPKASRVAMVQLAATPDARAVEPSDDAFDERAAEWRVIVVKSRIDSFSQNDLVEEIRTLRELGHKKIALDLKANRFLSLPMIKHCVDVADKVASEGGSFALIGCPEKTKRHFEIYGSLNHIDVVRSVAELAAPIKK